MIYRGERHRRDFLEQCLLAKNPTPEYTAAVYLLTADKKLYARVHKCIEHSRINFRKVKLKGISPYQHTLLAAAEDLYCDTMKLTLSDMSSIEVVDCRLFNLILTATSIKRNGQAAV